MYLRYNQFPFLEDGHGMELSMGISGISVVITSISWHAGAQMTRLPYTYGYNWLYIYILVGGLEHFLFFHMLGIILPTD